MLPRHTYLVLCLLCLLAGACDRRAEEAPAAPAAPAEIDTALRASIEALGIAAENFPKMDSAVYAQPLMMIVGCEVMGGPWHWMTRRDGERWVLPGAEARPREGVYPPMLEMGGDVHRRQYNMWADPSLDLWFRPVAW